MSINNIVKNLIESNQEGEYWDFKECWYHNGNQADLLHDIICFSNNLVNRDCYIIFGVQDQTFKIVGVDGDSNRRNTQNITDFLKDKHFARGIRPVVLVNTIVIDEHELDILTIKNSMNTPFYLTKSFQSVNQNNIYTRIQDSNTPKNRSADFDKIEYLWKKRFGLLLTPLEKIVLYLKDKRNWKDSNIDYGKTKYYLDHPEFTIRYEHDESKSGYEFYHLNQTDSRPSWYKIFLYYHQTLLADYQGIFLDGGRYFTPVPETDIFSIFLNDDHEESIRFRYFTKDSLQYTLHRFYYSKNSSDEAIARNRFLKCILVFSDQNEKESFVEYAQKYFIAAKNSMGSISVPYIEDLEKYNIEFFKNEFINIKILKLVYEKFLQRKEGSAFE